MKRITVFFVGKLAEPAEFQAIGPQLGPYAVAQQMFEAALHSELGRDEEVELVTFSFTLQPSFPRGPLLVPARTSDSGRFHLPYINITLLRELSLFIALIIQGVAAAVAGRRPMVVLQLSNYTPVTLGNRVLASLLRAKFVLTLTDLTNFTYRNERVARMSALKRLLVIPYRAIADRAQQAADAYIVFAEDMREKARLGSVPCLVMEGMFNAAGLDMTSSAPLDRPIIAHAGTLDRKLGVPLILEAFDRVRSPNAELWLIGSGDMDSEIHRRAEGDARIRHFGFQTRPRVFQLLKQARLLVNLRDPSEEFTRYSFPSKILEFLATGVPVASTRLRGIPGDYFAHIIPVDSTDPDVVGSMLEAIIQRDPSSLQERGMRGRSYVLANKNASAQVQRIRAFLARVHAG